MSEVVGSKRKSDMDHMVYNFLGKVMVVIRIKKVFDEFTSVKDYACGVIIRDIKDGEVLASRSVFSIIDYGYFEDFGCFKICP